MTTKTKIRALENHVLPESPEPTAIYIKNDAEISLYNKANRIRQNINVDIMSIWHNDKLTLDEKQKETLNAYNELGEKEKQIVSKDSDFCVRRLQDLLIKYFEATFPDKSREPLLRVTWFFKEMHKLTVAKYLEDSEWSHNAVTRRERQDS